MSTVVNKQTVRIDRGSHSSPEEGACVVEVASMLAGEKFSDHPRAVCPVLAVFMRTTNDYMQEDERQELYAIAADLVGTRAGFRVRHRRRRACLAWARQMESDTGLSTPVRLENRSRSTAHRCARLAVDRGNAIVLARRLIEIGGDPAPPVDVHRLERSTVS